jgi:hypothetical protein
MTLVTSEVGDKAMSAIGQGRINSEAMYQVPQTTAHACVRSHTLTNVINAHVSRQVLSTKPLLNAQTTYTTSMAPYNGTYTTFMRVCPPPCTLHRPWSSSWPF